MSSPTNKFRICKCFYTENYFVRAIQAHTRYESDEQFRRDYRDVPQTHGVSMTALLDEVNEERRRRIEAVEGEAQRRFLIKSRYVPLHKDLFEFTEEFLEQRFVALWRRVCSDDKELLAKYSVARAKFGLYQFPVFTKEFCRRLLEEVENFQNTDLPQIRPNTMNNYGILLDEIGFKQFFDTLRLKYLCPLANCIFPEWTGGRNDGLDSHRAFTVSYKKVDDKVQQQQRQQLDLAEHYDNAEVTLNVSLNAGYEGGEIYFGDVRTGPTTTMSPRQPFDQESAVEHRLGWGILHRGRQLHGALQIESGSRHNLILWMRSSVIRNLMCPRCWMKPTLIPVPEDCYGDGFTG